MTTNVKVSEEVIERIIREEINEQISEQLDGSINAIVSKHIGDLIQSEYAKAIRVKVEKTLDDAMQKTKFTIPDGYNKTRSVTLDERIQEAFVSFLGERVDRHGKVPTYSSDAKCTRIEWIVKDGVEKVYNDQFSATVQNELKKLTETLSSVTTEKVKAGLSKAFSEIFNKK